MKNKQNAWIAPGLLVIVALVATVYCLLEYRSYVVAVGLSTLFLLGAAFWLFLTISRMQKTETGSAAEQKEQMQYEGLKLQGEEMVRLMNTVGKGTYVYTKRSAESLERILMETVRAQKSNDELLDMLIRSQTKTAKFQVKYGQEDTTRIVGALTDHCAQINANLESCVREIKGQQAALANVGNSSEEDRRVADSIRSLSEELSRINGSILALQMQINSQPQIFNGAQFVSPVQPMMQTMPAEPVAPTMHTEAEMDAALQAAMAEEPAVIEKDELVQPVMETVEEAVAEPVVEEVPVAEPVEEAPKPIVEEVPEPAVEEAPAPEPAPAPTLEVSGDPNKPMSPDEIAAMFAAAEGAAEPGPEPVVEEAPAPAPAPTLEVSGDPNKPMSPDEIAAMFAAAEGAAEPVPEPVVEEAPAPEPEPAPAPTLEVSGDPNKPMSPDEIAAMFAAVGGGAAEPAPEPEPAPAPDLGGDPNKQLSPDEIAALFASMG